MLKRIRPRLTYANVMVTLLAFIVLGGGAYAATKLAKNSVGTNQIKNSAVTGKKVKSGTLTSKNFASGTLTQGAQGPQGPQGDPGVQGATGLTGGVLSAVDFFSIGAGVTTFNAVSGRTGAAATNANADSLSPDAPLTAKNLSVKLNTAPTGGGGTFTVTLMVSDVASALTCTITSPATTCTAAGPVSVPPGSPIALQLSNGSTTPIGVTSTGFLLTG